MKDFSRLLIYNSYNVNERLASHLLQKVQILQKAQI